MATECLCINMMETRNVVGSCDVTVHLLYAINQYVYIELLINNFRKTISYNIAFYTMIEAKTVERLLILIIHLELFSVTYSTLC